MNEDLHRHLDGETALESLEGEVRKEAEAWNRLLVAFRTEIPEGVAPPWLEHRIMSEIDALPEPGFIRRALSWLVAPRPVSLSPLSAGLVTAALAVALVVSRFGPGVVGPGPVGVEGSGSTLAGETDAVSQVVYVQFALEAPGASSVAVAGDFDGWQGAHSLQDVDGDGVWTGRVPVEPGVHAYMFLVDGSTWMTDPRADRYQDDGFGNRNAVLAVAIPTV